MLITSVYEMLLYVTHYAEWIVYLLNILHKYYYCLILQVRKLNLWHLPKRSHSSHKVEANFF